MSHWDNLRKEREDLYFKSFKYKSPQTKNAMGLAADSSLTKDDSESSTAKAKNSRGKSESLGSAIQPVDSIPKDDEWKKNIEIIAKNVWSRRWKK